MTKIPLNFNHIVSSNLNLFSSNGDICSLCDAAIAHDLLSVLVFPTSIPFCANLLNHTSIKLDAVIAYPHGRSTLKSKIAEINEVAQLGADAVTVYINYSALRAGEKNVIAEEIQKLAKICQKISLDLTIALEGSILEPKHLKFALNTSIQSKVDAFLSSYGASFSETCHQITQLASDKKSPIKLQAYLKKLNPKLIHKLNSLGADTIISDGELNKMQ